MIRFTFVAVPLAIAGLATPLAAEEVGYGPRPGYLIDRMAEGPLKEKLAGCMGQAPARSGFLSGTGGAAALSGAYS